MSLLYDFNIETVDDILKTVARNFQKRRLEKGLSRNTLSEISGVPHLPLPNLSKNTLYLWLPT